MDDQSIIIDELREAIGRYDRCYEQGVQDSSDVARIIIGIAKLAIAESKPELLKLRQRVQELEERQRWIPVSERLPEPNTVVWGSTDDGLVGKRYIDEHGDWHHNDMQGNYCMLPITHWMNIYLPEPPEVK